MTFLSSSLVFLAIFYLSAVAAQKKLSECYDNRCFKLQKTATSVSSAEQQCKTLYNGILAEITDDNLWTKIIDDMLGKTLTGNIWLGLKVRPRSNTLQRANQTAVTLPQGLYWTTNTITTDSNERCMAAAYSNWKWSLLHCGHSYPYLCEHHGFSCSIGDVKIDNADFENCLTNSNIMHGTSLEVQCWPGHQIQGPPSITCTDAKWSQIPQCLPGCPPPAPRVNSKLVTTNPQPFYKTEETITFVCNKDHIIWQTDIKTHFTSTCTKYGEWSQPTKDCIAREKREQKVILINGNDMLELLCPIANPIGTVQWMMNDREVVLQGNLNVSVDGSLYIFNPSTKDQGLYYCIQKDHQFLQVGDTFYDLVLQTNCTSSGDYLPTEVHYLNEGSSVILGCFRTTNEPQAQWLKNGNLISPSADCNVLPNGALLLKNVKLHDIGYYSCLTDQVMSKTCKWNITHRLLISANTNTICGIKKEISTSSFSDSIVHQPWVVTLWQDDEVFPFCYGTVIDRQWVITTGFCLSSFRRKKTLGLSVEIGHGTNDTVRVSIASVKVHPYYRQRLNAHDIGLAKLEDSLVTSKMNIFPICLPEGDLIKKPTCQKLVSINGTVSGWGSLEIETAKNVNLTVEGMALVEKDVCLEEGKFGFASDMFCAEGISNQKPMFAGDNGAPFMVKWKNRIYLAGIYSWGERVTEMGKYDYFTNVAKHIDWIKTVINS